MPIKHTDQEIIDALEQAGSQAKAAKMLGVNLRSFKRRIASLRRKGYSPDHDMTKVCPDGYRLKGTSTLYGEDGSLKMQWVKTTKDDERQAEMLQAFVEGISAEIPRAKPVLKPCGGRDDLCNLYTISDMHLGCLAWHQENLDADWDLSIAYRTVLGCFKQMIESAPNASTCVISELGDGLHSDGLLPVTPTSGNVLDSDSRFGKIVSSAIKLIREVVAYALERHETVHLVIAEGNHNLSSSIWMRKLFGALYEDEPRVTVDQSETPYYVYQHGQTMLCMHHGHLKKNDQLPLFFAAQYPLVWGGTKKRYCHTGHRHHLEEKEHAGMIVTQHPTLASRDAHASRHGYISNRAALCHTYHKTFGHVATNQVCPEMVSI